MIVPTKVLPHPTGAQLAEAFGPLPDGVQVDWELLEETVRALVRSEVRRMALREDPE